MMHKRHIQTYNVKFFSAQKHRTNWINEVSGYRKTGKHVVIFKRPVRDGGLQSIRKMKDANRVYGTKKRGVSEKVSELSAVYVDEPVDIELKEEELDPFDGALRLFPIPKAREIMLLVDSDVVMHGANDGLQVEHVVEEVTCTDIVDQVFDDAKCKISECHRKDLEILDLKKQLALEQLDSERRVREACNLAKFNMEEMAVECEKFHRTLMSTIYGHLEQASKVSSEEALRQITQSEFFKRSMKDLSKGLFLKPFLKLNFLIINVFFALKLFSSIITLI